MQSQPSKKKIGLHVIVVALNSKESPFFQINPKKIKSDLFERLSALPPSCTIWGKKQLENDCNLDNTCVPPGEKVALLYNSWKCISSAGFLTVQKGPLKGNVVVAQTTKKSRDKDRDVRLC